MTDHVTLLKESGLKATFQRMNILETIEKHGHITIDAIYEEVSRIHASLSLATVYKNILLMLEKKVLVEVPVAGQKSKYELKKDDHIHLVCTVCGMVEDKPLISSVDTLIENMTKEENFSLSSEQINLYGICHNCQEQKAS
ncbi:Fur family transcriptional regulator [Sulfurovum sp. zt1-1]|uniref:Fur family transcriptional regulator n=1 Tax=Sulfurovum zhangzhouensis TaxID=3019067 RepID=A0ABT7QYU9_9BACT|nr:Fur family transcriptional regulator [Sulfurovum zhangzhouensis]MDM5272003.1 Fur family transcriptional regulator [Sulfurovum zhangzhouensis]